jgi:hypothetical protein
LDSYSPQDDDFAQQLCADLQAKNVRCWKFDENAKWGEPVWGERGGIWLRAEFLRGPFSLPGNEQVEVPILRAAKESQLRLPLRYRLDHRQKNQQSENR